ncbi:hypothetical protein [Tardiphaga sp. 42S5]|uniref:hypothetical protein n=1 Tax=Tardiphaga sp. 42S5 TaxID=1404799 RepID=UPI002A5AF3E2|nr:hypothetical protein [Tardiphaga sp. 42S5]WPO40397.1 hypothetical protein SFY93_23090 [Tardiphaga sp. 42S5]
MLYLKLVQQLADPKFNDRFNPFATVVSDPETKAIDRCFRLIFDRRKVQVE